MSLSFLKVWALIVQVSRSLKKSHFKHKYVFITGAASGIGRQLSQDFYFKQHSHLILLDRNAKGLESLKKDLENMGSRLHQSQKIEIIKCDLSSKDSVEKALKKTATLSVDVLINSAGITCSGLFEKTNIEDFEKVIEINLMGMVRITRALLPKLLKSKDSVIANIASLGGLIGMPGMSAYSASKFAVVGFSEALHLELLGRVAVCTICPAFVKTHIIDNAILEPHSRGKDLRAQKMNDILTKLGSNPQKASTTIISAIVQKKKLTLINADAYVLYYLKKFVPFFNDSLMSLGFKKLLKQGVFKS
jgi:short-subunit dehydrogenase